MASPVNQSKGCGGVMRVAPVGLAFKAIDQAFQIGCECAAITHGHPSGFLASGVLAAMICSIVSGAPVWNAVHDAISLLKERPHHEECLQALEQAIDLSHKAEPSPDKVETIGAGWVAEEALAIGVYCALTTPHDFGKGVLLAVNHSGDSDSTGAIAGNIIGAAMGVGAIPDEWLAHLELAQEIEETAVDLYHGFSRNDPDPV